MTKAKKNFSLIKAGLNLKKATFFKDLPHL